MKGLTDNGSTAGEGRCHWRLQHMLSTAGRMWRQDRGDCRHSGHCIPCPLLKQSTAGGFGAHLLRVMRMMWCWKIGGAGIGIKAPAASCKSG